MKYKLRLGITLFTLLVFASCVPLHVSDLQGNNLIFGKNVTPIQRIKATQDKQGIFYIQGKVERKVPLLDRRAYLINDSTGKIWVLTDQSNFREDDAVVIKGKLLYQSIPIADQEFGEIYLEEQ